MNKQTTEYRRLQDDLYAAENRLLAFLCLVMLVVIPLVVATTDTVTTVALREFVAQFMARG